jgi:hypothetical protein
MSKYNLGTDRVENTASKLSPPNIMCVPAANKTS